jgi:hypothetical protein
LGLSRQGYAEDEIGESRLIAKPRKSAVKKKELATIKGMIGKDKIDMADVLMGSQVTVQLLQDSPQARRDVSALLSVPRTSKKSSRRLAANLVTTVGSVEQVLVI